MPETKPTSEQAPKTKERLKSAESRLREISKLIWGDVTRIIEGGKQKLREKFGGGSNEEELTRLADATRLTEKQVTRIGEDTEKNLKEVAEQEEGRFQKNQPILINGNEGKFLEYVTQGHVEKALVKKSDGVIGPVFLDQIAPIEQPHAQKSTDESLHSGADASQSKRSPDEKTQESTGEDEKDGAEIKLKIFRNNEKISIMMTSEGLVEGKFLKYEQEGKVLVEMPDGRKAKVHLNQIEHRTEESAEQRLIRITGVDRDSIDKLTVYLDLAEGLGEDNAKRAVKEILDGKGFIMPLTTENIDLRIQEFKRDGVTVEKVEPTETKEEAEKNIDKTTEPETKKFEVGDAVTIVRNGRNPEDGFEVISQDETGQVHLYNEFTDEDIVLPPEQVGHAPGVMSKDDIGEQWRETPDSTIKAESESVEEPETEETTKSTDETEESPAAEEELKQRLVVRITGVSEDDISQLTSVLESLTELDWDAAHEVVKQITKGGTYTLPVRAEDNVDDIIDELETNGATAEKVEPTAAEGEAEPKSEQISEEAKAFQQAKLEARFGKENAEKLQTEYILENEKYKGAINEMVETILLSPGKETRQEEAKIVKKMAGAFGEYFSETTEEQKEGACWEILNAIKAHITDEAAKTESKSIKRKLAKGAAYFGAGFGGSILLGPLGGILIAGGLRQVDTFISHRASKKQLKEYKEAANTDKSKTRLGNTITDLILSKKKDGLLRKKHKEGETWKVGGDSSQLEFAERYYKNALDYLKTRQAEQIEGLSEAQIQVEAEIIATYFAIDDNTEKMLKELEISEDGKENTKWNSLVNFLRKRGLTDNTPAKKFYSAAAATGIGLGIRGAVTTMGMSSKWVRRTMMAFAGYKLGGALGEMAGGKKSPEAITKKSLESLKNYDFSAANSETILDNFSKEITRAKVAISEIPQTAKNKLQIEKWNRELESREFELLNETIIKNTENKFTDEAGKKRIKTTEFILGFSEREAKKEISSETKKAKIYKIAGRAIGIGLGLLTAEASGAIMQKISEHMQGDEAAGSAEIETTEPTEATRANGAIETEGAGTQKLEAPTEEDFDLIRQAEGPPKPPTTRPAPSVEHEFGKAEMSTAKHKYMGGKSIWEESENRLEATLGHKPTVEQIDAMKDQIVANLGYPDGDPYYEKMTEDQIEEAMNTIKTAPPQGLKTPDIEHIPEPTAPPTPTEVPHDDIISETGIIKGDELPKYTPPEMEAKGTPIQERAIKDGLLQSEPSEPEAMPEVVKMPIPEKVPEILTSDKELRPNTLNIESTGDRNYDVIWTDETGQPIKTSLKMPNEYTKITAMKGPNNESLMKITNTNTKKSVIVKIAEVKEESKLRYIFGGETVTIEGKNGKKMGFKRLTELLGRPTSSGTPVESFDLSPASHKAVTGAWTEIKVASQSPVPLETPEPTEWSAEIPKIQHTDIQKPTAPPTEGLSSLAAETEISHDTETPEPLQKTAQSPTEVLAEAKTATPNLAAAAEKFDVSPADYKRYNSAIMKDYLDTKNTITVMDARELAKNITIVNTLSETRHSEMVDSATEKISDVGVAGKKKLIDYLKANVKQLKKIENINKSDDIKLFNLETYLNIIEEDIT